MQDVKPAAPQTQDTYKYLLHGTHAMLRPYLKEVMNLAMLPATATAVLTQSSPTEQPV